LNKIFESSVSQYIKSKSNDCFRVYLHTQTTNLTEELLISPCMKKDELVRVCRDFLVQRINENKTEIELLNQDLLSESKSTAGDKHETGRAMIHLEAEKSVARLREHEELLLRWDRIDFTEEYTSVKPGAFVTTDHGSFLISVGAGKVMINTQDIHLLSSSSPLAQALNGKTVGDAITLQQRQYHILSIA